MHFTRHQAFYSKVPFYRDKLQFQKSVQISWLTISASASWRLNQWMIHFQYSIMTLFAAIALRTLCCKTSSWNSFLEKFKSTIWKPASLIAVFYWLNTMFCIIHNLITPKNFGLLCEAFYFCSIMSRIIQYLS